MERLTLPLPARGIWLRVRSLLESAIERLGPEAGSWKIGGGTVLAARWNHRESIDLDLTVNAGAAIPALSTGPANDFAAENRPAWRIRHHLRPRSVHRPVQHRQTGHLRAGSHANVGFVETRTRNGAERKVTVEPARIDEILEANGLNHYLPQTGVRPVHIRDRMRTACREGSEFLHDTAANE